ncbi:unnamed protein product [Spodoptera littoralis]|uniref:Sulfotransferase domain-containing protein n=1 Tax=Spodoptera littoralis TaxID=7109 RepID=A0A9P0IDL6_SPOLI|nr:unnamed protein product [Spodoptera littoralis]CAH1645912.1 unnamed protein product [Spodoptera littoralis]
MRSTLTRELVWILANDWDFAKSETVPLFARFMFLEFPTLVHPLMNDNILREMEDASKIAVLEIITKPGTMRLAEAKSPRFIYTHLALSLLPAQLLDTAMIVFM